MFRVTAGIIILLKELLFTWNFVSDADLPFARFPNGFEFSQYDSSGLASVTDRYW
jgi:hypothetical protein